MDAAALDIRIKSSGIKQATRDLGSLEKNARKTETATQRMERSFQSLKRIAVTAFAGWGIAQISRDILQTSNAFVQFRMTLQTLEGDIDTANKKWGELMQFAQDTPFRIGQVMNAYKTMKAYGLDPTIRAMRILGDTASVMGGDTLPRIAVALGQINATGKVSAQDLNQLSQAGINVDKALKSAFNVGRAGLDKLNTAIASGAVSMRNVYDTFLNYMQSHFGGQMEKMNSTLKGQWEVLISIWQQFEDNLINGSSEISLYLTTILKNFNQWLMAIREDGNALAGLGEIGAVGFNILLKGAHLLEKSFRGLQLIWDTLRIAFWKFVKEYSEGIAKLGRENARFYRNLSQKALDAGWIDTSRALTGLSKAFLGMAKGAKTANTNLLQAQKDLGEHGKAITSDKSAIDNYLNSLKTQIGLLKSNSAAIGKNTDALANNGGMIKDVSKLSTKAAKEVVKAWTKINRITLMALPEYERGLESIHREYEQANKDLDKYGALNGKTVAEIAQLHKDLGLRMDEDLAKYAKSHEETTEKVSEAWINAYNKISDTLADWIQTGKFSLGNFFDWIKRSLAQLAATRIVGSAAMALGLPGAAAWAGIGAGGSVAGGVAGGGGSQSLYGAGASLVGGLWQGMGNVGTSMSILPTNLTASIGSAFDDMGFSAGKSFMASLNHFFANHASVSGGLTAGLGTFLLSGLMTGDWGQAAWTGGGAGLGAAIGTAIFPGVGTFLGGIGGGFIGKLFGGIFGGNIKRGYLGEKYEYTQYSPESGWGEGEMVDQWREDRNGDDWIESANEMAQSGLELMNAMDSTFKKLLGAFGGEEYVTRFTTAMGKLAMGENPTAETYAGQAPLGTHGLAFSYYISAENEDEFQEDWLRSWKRLTQGLIDPIVDVGTNLLREALDETISDSSVWNYFTDDFKTYIEDNLEKSLGDLKVDWSQVTDEESLKKALETMGMAAENIGAIIEHFDKIGAIMNSISDAIEMHGLSGAAQNAIKSFRGINAQFATFATTLKANGIDLEKYTDLEKTHQLAIEDASYAMAQAGIDGNDFVIALEKMQEEMEEAGKTAEEVAGAINAAMKGVIDSIGDIYRELEHGGPLSLAETIAGHYEGATAADIEGISNARWRAITEEVADAWAAAGSPGDYGTWAKETYGAQLVADWNDWGAHLANGVGEAVTNGIQSSRYGEYDTSQQQWNIGTFEKNQLDPLTSQFNETLNPSGQISGIKAKYAGYEETFKQYDTLIEEQARQWRITSEILARPENLLGAYREKAESIKRWQAYVQKVRNLAKQAEDAELGALGKSIMAPIMEVLETVGMTEHELAIRTLDKKYEGYIEQLEAAGLLTENAAKVLAAYNIELGNLADREAELAQQKTERARQKAEQAVTEARNNLIGALQREISEYQEAQNALQSAFDTAKSAYITGLQAEISIKQDAIRTIKDTISSFDNLLDSISDYRKELITSANVLSPDMQYKMAQAQFAEAVQGLYSDDQEVIQKSLEDIPGLSKDFLNASLAANANFNDYMADFSKVMTTLNTAEDIGKVQKTIAGKSLDALDSQVDVLEQTLGTLQEQLLPLAELQANYNNAKWALDTSVYSALIEADQVQLTALQAINNSVLSVTNALRAYHSAQTGVLSSFSGGKGYMLGGGISITRGEYGFASGGTISGPESGYQMPATFHGVEHITPDSQMKEVKETLKEVKGVLIQLRDTNGDQNKINKKLYRIFDRVSQDEEYLRIKAV